MILFFGRVYEKEKGSTYIWVYKVHVQLMFLNTIFLALKWFLFMKLWNNLVIYLNAVSPKTWTLQITTNVSKIFSTLSPSFKMNKLKMSKCSFWSFIQNSLYNLCWTTLITAYGKQIIYIGFLFPYPVQKYLFSN